MIENYIVGDLFKAPNVTHIAHGCNAKGVMGSGFAKAVRDNYPECYDSYKKHYHDYGLELGTIHVYENKIANVTIFNCITQENFGRDGRRYVSYDAIASCFKELNECSWYWQIKRLSIPKIGSMLGGGDWSVIEAIINSETPKLPIDVYVLE